MCNRCEFIFSITIKQMLGTDIFVQSSFCFPCLQDLRDHILLSGLSCFLSHFERNKRIVLKYPCTSKSHITSSWFRRFRGRLKTLPHYFYMRKCEKKKKLFVSEIQVSSSLVYLFHRFMGLWHQRDTLFFLTFLFSTMWQASSDFEENVCCFSSAFSIS